MSEPVLLSIAAALATQAVRGLYQLVKAKFADDPAATAALEAAEGAAEDSPEVRELGATLEQATQDDPEFAERLRGEWERFTSSGNAQTGGVVNQVSGQVDKLVQARDIHGGITF